MKSIMHPKTERTCYLCQKLHGEYGTMNNLEEHHVFGGVANRPLSERYGLKVYLCQGHHRTSYEAVHVNAEVAAVVKEDAQRAFEAHFPELSFREIFGKNYLVEEEEVRSGKPGFFFLEGAI